MDKITVSIIDENDGWLTFVFSDGKQMRDRSDAHPDREATRHTLETMVNLAPKSLTFVTTIAHRYPVR